MNKSSSTDCINRFSSCSATRFFTLATSLAAFGALLLVGIGTAAANTTADWNGATDGDISNSANYSGSPTLGPTVDLRFFNIAETNAPSTDSLNPLSIGELIFTNVIDPGSPITIGQTSGGTITINGDGANGINDTALEAITLNVPISLGTTAQTWTNNSINALTIQGPITNGATNLTLQGVGSIILNGGITGTGAGSLTLGGNNGTTSSVATLLTLNAASNYTGGTIFNDGTVRINNASAIGTGLLTIGTTSTVYLDNTSGSAISLSTNNLQTWNAGFIFNGTNSLNLGTGAVTMSANSTISVLANTLTVGGNITGTGTLTKNGPGILALNGVNTFTTGITLAGGTLDIGNASSLGSTLFTITSTTNDNGAGTNPSPIQPENAASFPTLPPATINNTSGSAITLTNSTVALNGNFFFAGSNANTNSDINFGTGTETMNGTRSVVALGGTLTFGGTETSNQQLDTIGAGKFVITSTNNAYTLNVGLFQNGFVNNGGTVTLSGAGTLTNGNSVNVFDNGVFTLDNSGTNQNNRLTAGAAGTGRGLSLNGDTTFNLIGNATTPTVESSGQLQFSQGNNLGGGTFPATSGMGTVNLVSNGQSVQYTANSLNFPTGTALFRGTNLGTAPIGTPTANTTNMIFNTAPSTGNGLMFGGNGTAGTNTVSIIKYAIGDNVVGGVDNYGLVTYDTNFGIRLLDPTTEYLLAGTSTPLSGSTANTNVLLDQTANNSGAPFTTTGTVATNSITLANGTTLTGTLTSNSAIYAANGGANSLTLTNGLNNSAVFDVMGASTTLALNTSITGNGFVFVSGNGTLIANAPENQNGGALTVGGTLRVGVDNFMTNFINPNGIAISGTLDLNGHNLVTPVMTNNGFAGSGTITNSTTTPVTLTFQGETPGGNNNFNNAPFAGNINNGAGAGLVTVTKTGVQAMLLDGGGNYSGGLNVLNGALVLGSDTAQGGNTTVNVGDTSGSNNAALLFGTSGTFGQPGLFNPSTLHINFQAGSTGIATFGVDLGSQSGYATTFDGSVTLGKNAYISGDYDERVSGAPLSGGHLVTFNNNNIGSYLVVGAGTTFSGPGSLTQNGGVIVYMSPSNAGFTLPGGYGVILGNTDMMLTNQLTPGTFSFATTDGTTPASITLNGNGLIQNAVTTGAANFTVVTPGTGHWTINDPFTIGPNGGSISVSTTLQNNSGGLTSIAQSSVTFSGPITLGGTLLLNGTQLNANNSTFTDGDALSTHFTGHMTLPQTAGAASGLRYTSGLTNAIPINDIVDSVIVDGTGGENNPLYLTGGPNTNAGGTFNLTGVSTYSGGTVINPALGIINVVGAGQSLGTPATTYAVAGQLGTGNVTILPGGKLRLNSSANLAAGASVVVTSGLLNAGFLDIAFNPATQAGLDVNPSSTGTLAIDTSSFSLNLNQSTLSTSGTMFVGSLSAGTDSGTIIAGSGGANGTYRLGGGNGTLTFSNSNAIATVGANLIVDQVGGFDQNNLPYGVQNGQGTVKFTAPQANLTGDITVNGGMTANTTGVYSGILEFAVPSGTAANPQPIGTGANNVTLNGGSLQFDPPTTANKNSVATIGNLIVNGGPSSLTTNNDGTGNNTQGPASGSTITINGPLGIVRNEGATLFVGLSTTNPNNGGDPAQYVLGPPGQINVTGSQGQPANSLSGTGGTFFAVTNNSLAGPGTGSNPATAIGNFIPAGSVSNGMATYGLAQTPGDGTNVAPWIMYNSSGTGGTFLAYTTAGFVPSIPTVNNVAGVLTFATGSQMVNTIPSDIVFIQNTASNTDASMTQNSTIFALESTKASGTVAITSTSSAPITLTVTSGGISADEQNGNMTFGISAPSTAPTPANGVNVQFGATGTTEAVLYVGSNNGSTSMIFQNQVIAGNVTKTGLGSLFLLNPSANGGTPLASANQISGNVTIDEGLIQTGTNGGGAGNGIGELALGPIPTSVASQGNSIVLNGGGWMIQSDTSTTISHNIVVGAAGGIFGGGTQQSQTKTYNGSIMDDPNLPAGAAAGPLTLSMRNNSAFTFAPTLFATGTAQNQWSGGTLIQGGGTIIVQNGVNFGTGSVEVFSPSTLTLQGNTNLGQDTIANPSGAARLTVDLGSTANFQSAAPIIGSLDGGGSVVLGNATGPVNTILQVGTNNVSTTFSGNISQASGSVSGLTKVGTGALTLTGTSSYSGATAVTNGTLRFNGSLTGTGAFTVGDSVNAGSTPMLTGTGVIAGPVTVLGTSSPSAGAVGGTSGAMLVLNGGLTLNDGSISNFVLTTAGANNTNALIATFGGGGNSLVFTGGTDHINLSGTALLGGTYDLLSFTDSVAPLGTFVIGNNTISTPNLSYSIQVTSTQVDLIVSAATVDTWTGASNSNWDIGGANGNNNWAVTTGASTVAGNYTDGDNVVFGDTNVLTTSALTSPQNIVITAAAVNPSSVMFNNNSTVYTISGGAISGATGLVLNGSQSVTLESANSFTGSVAINHGELILQNSNALGSGSTRSSGVMVASGAALQLQNAISVAAVPLTITGTGSSGAGALQSSNGSNSYAGLVTIGSSGATVTSSTLGNTLTLTGGVNTAGNLLTINGSGNTTVSTAGITGGGGVTYSGTGTLALSAANGYTGPTTLDSGTLRLTGSLNAGSAVAIGGTSSSASGSPTLTGNGTINGSLTVFGGGSGNVAGHVAPSGFTGSSGTTLNLGGALTFNTGSDLNFNLNSITSSGNDSISVTGSGAVNYGTGGVLNINAYNTNLAAGVYTLVNDASSTSATGGTAWTVGTSNDPNRPAALGGNGLESYSIGLVGNNLDLTITNTAIFWAGATSSWDTTSTSNWVTSTGQTLKYFNGIAVQFGDTHPPGSTPVGTTSVAIQSAGVTPQSVTFTNATSNYTVSTSGSVGIGGSTGVTLNGAGTVTFTSPNTFTGPVAVNDGQLNLQNSGAVASSSGVTVAPGAALQLQGGVSIGSTLLSISGSGLTASPAGALQSVSGANSYAGAISVGSGGATIASSNSGNTLTLTGGITNNGNLVTFSGAGNTAVNSAINGLGGLTYAGAGTLTLSATNGYSDVTTVKSGTLRLTGSLAAASTVTVGGTTASGASGTATTALVGGTPTLIGNGTVNGSLVVFASGTGNVAGHLAPSGFTGSSATALNVGGDLTLNGGSVLDFNLSNNPDGPGASVPTGPNGFNDHINVAGTLTLNGGGQLFINDPAGLSVGTYELVDYGNLSGSAAGWQMGGTFPSQFNYAFTTVNAGQFDLVVTTGSGSGEWISDINQLYNNGPSWSSNAAPDGAGQSATFGTGNQKIVKVNGSFTVGSLNFTSGSAYTLESLTAAEGLTLNNLASDAQVNVADGAAADFLYTQVNLASATGNTTFTIQPGSSLVASAFNIDSTQVGLAGSNQGITLAGGGTLELAATNTYTGPTHVNSGTLLIDAGASIASTSITVGMGGTLQLAGTTHALPSGANIKTSGNRDANDGAIMLSGAATESIGAITSDPTTNVDGAQVYAGNTTVGDGASPASLTATQILQNTLTINANSTVTIAPSAGAGGGVVAAASAAPAAAASSTASSVGTGDPLAAIQDAIASGSITSVKGQQLENRIAAIERLAATDPGLDASLLESRVLAALPSTSILPSISSAADASPLADTSSDLLAADTSSFGTGSSGSGATFAPSASFSGSPAAVPEPSTLLLAALGGIGLAFAARRRKVNG